MRSWNGQVEGKMNRPRLAQERDSSHNCASGRAEDGGGLGERLSEGILKTGFGAIDLNNSERNCSKNAVAERWPSGLRQRS